MIVKLSETKVDDLVISEAFDDNAWEKAIRVNKKRAYSVSFSPPSEIASQKSVLMGEPVFRGTRVPVAALFDSLESGGSLDGFLSNFPSVSRYQAINVLEYFKKSLVQLKEVA